MKLCPQRVTIEGTAYRCRLNEGHIGTTHRDRQMAWDREAGQWLASRKTPPGTSKPSTDKGEEK